MSEIAVFALFFLWFLDIADFFLHTVKKTSLTAMFSIWHNTGWSKLYYVGTGVYIYIRPNYLLASLISV